MKDRLIELQKRIFYTIMLRYDYYTRGKAKTLSQVYGRNLVGFCEEEWSKIEATVANFAAAQIKNTIKKNFQKHTERVIGKKAIEIQQ